MEKYLFVCLLRMGKIIFELSSYIDVNIIVENYKTSILGIQATLHHFQPYFQEKMYHIFNIVKLGILIITGKVDFSF